MFLNRQDRFKQNSTNICATKYSLDRRWSHAGHGTITTSTQRKKLHLLKTMLASVTTMNLILGTILITSLIRGKDVCHSQSIGSGTHLFENSVENKALVDHTFLSTTNTLGTRAFILGSRNRREKTKSKIVAQGVVLGILLSLMFPLFYDPSRYALQSS